MHSPTRDGTLFSMRACRKEKTTNFVSFHSIRCSHFFGFVRIDVVAAGGMVVVVVVVRVHFFFIRTDRKDFRRWRSRMIRGEKTLRKRDENRRKPFESIRFVPSSIAKREKRENVRMNELCKRRRAIDFSSSRHATRKRDEKTFLSRCHDDLPPH